MYSAITHDSATKHVVIKNHILQPQRNQGFGKLEQPRQEKAIANGFVIRRLLMIDRKTEIIFLVDTRLDVSVLLKSCNKRRNIANI